MAEEGVPSDGSQPGPMEGREPSDEARAVLFDLDDTLMAHREAVGEALLGHLRALGHPYDPSNADAEVAYWRALEEQHYHRYLGGEIGYDEQRRERARDFAVRHGVALAVEEREPWFRAYFERYEASWRLYDDVLPCLDELERRIPDVRFGVITNGELDRQLRKLDAIGVRDRFDLVVDVTDVDSPKPDPAAYRHALDVLGESPERCVAIEDNVGGTEAATAAGLRSVAFPNANTAGHDFPAATARTDRLDEADLLGQVAPA